MSESNLFVAGAIQHIRLKKSLAEKLNNFAKEYKQTSKTDCLHLYIDELQRKKPVSVDPIKVEGALQQVMGVYPEKADLWCPSLKHLVKRSECRAMSKLPCFEKICKLTSPPCKEAMLF